MLWYIQKADALQRKKTFFFQQSLFNKGTTKKIFSRKTIVENLTTEELESYRQLQELFSQVNFLIHFFNEKTFYIDIDATKKREFGAMVYHLKITCLNPEKPKRSDIELIFFFSRMLNEAETKYWPTELETAGLVWVIRKVRHMIKAAKQFTVIFIDHVANIVITK